MRASDDDVRQQALDITQSFIVQAPAGSGKTALLIQRYLALLATVGEPEEVMAITFTRKAAAEMRYRVLQALQQSGADQPQDAHAAQTWSLARAVMQHSEQSGWNLQMQPARLRILTIDALNAMLVKRMPGLSGIGMDAALETGSDLYEEAAWNTLNRRDASAEVAQHIETLLLHLDNKDRQVVDMLSRLLARRDQWLRHLVPLGQKQQQDDVRTVLSGMFESALEEELQGLADAIDADTLDELVRIASIAAQRLWDERDRDEGERQLSDRIPHLILRDTPIALGAGFDSIAHWRAIARLYLTAKGSWRTARGFNAKLGFPPKCDEKQAYEALYESLNRNETLRQRLLKVRDYPETVYSDRQWKILDALIGLLPVAVAQLQLVFRRHGAVDYTEQALAARRALGQGDDVTDLSLKLDYQLKHILMDEFQDTSRSQFTLLEQLLAGWSHDEGRTLFLVGDPMQSIYRFREADVSGFLGVREHGIAALKPQSLVLETNFRSTPTLVNWFNEVFPGVLAEQDDVVSGAVRYTPATPMQLDCEGTQVCPCIEMDRSPDEELSHIAQTVTELIQKHSEESVAVLVRSRRHLYGLFDHLEQRHIAFNAVDIKSLPEQPAIQDLLSITSSLLHRHDRIAWLAVLRAPWCGLTLDSLHRLVAAHPKRDVWSLLNDQALCAMLDEDEQTRLQRVVRVYRDIFAQHHAITLATRVTWLWHRLGASACHAGSEDDVELYLQQLAELEKQHDIISPALIQRHLQQLFSNRMDSRAKVQLMTIHKSKGLEFDSVILPALDRGVRADTKDLLVWHEERSKDFSERLLLAPIPATASQDASFDYVRKREQQCAEYENQRLLYVAATRARRRLYLYGTLKSGADGDTSPPRKGSFLALLGDRVSPDRGVDPVDIDEMLGGLDSLNDEPREQAQASRQIPKLKRLRPGWQPVCDAHNINWSQDVQRIDEILPVEFSWAGQSARLAGTVVHRYLQWMAEQGMAAWSGQRLLAARPSIMAMLTSEGLPPEHTEQTAELVIQALSNVLASSRGQWILADYPVAHNEYAVSGIIGGQIINRIIDRTFVDESGIRWIVDYKTSSHRGGNREAFLDEEQRRYYDQLNRYARLLAAGQDGEVRCGLYFPVMDAWREWQYDPDSDSASLRA